MSTMKYGSLKDEVVASALEGGGAQAHHCVQHPAEGGVTVRKLIKDIRM